MARTGQPYDNDRYASRYTPCGEWDSSRPEALSEDIAATGLITALLDEDTSHGGEFPWL
jgi:hypothetical protein